MSSRIRELVESLQRVYMARVTELLLTGPLTTNKRFHEAIRAAFQDLKVDESVLVSLGHGNSSLSDNEEWRSLLIFAIARGPQKSRSAGKKGQYNVPRAMSAGGGGRVYTVRKTHYC